MRKLSITFAFAALACLFASAMLGQTAPQQQQQHLIGEVTAVDESTGRITLRTDAGVTVTVLTDERTVYRRVPPGETSLARAEQIKRADLRAGDRVLVPGGAAGGAQTAAAASQIIVTAREAVAGRREREDWRRRGVAGRVVALEEGRKEITIETRAREGGRAITVDASANSVRFLRYAPDSFRRADARPGAFADIHVGDQLRALGERSADGSHLTAEEVVSGTVERIVGTVAAVDTARGEVTVKNEQTGRAVVFTVGRNTTLRRIPHEVAEELAERGEQQRREAAGGVPARPQTDARGGGSNVQQQQRPAGRSVQQIFESLPVIKTHELKKGDTAVVTATTGADTARATAVSIIAGEANMLRWLQRFQRVADEPREMSPGLPSTVMGGNTGSNDEP